MKYLRLQKFSVRSRGSATAAATATRTRHACLSSLVVARKNGSALAPTHVCHARAEFEDTEKSQQQESSMNQDNSMFQRAMKVARSRSGMYSQQQRQQSSRERSRGASTSASSRGSNAQSPPPATAASAQSAAKGKGKGERRSAKLALSRLRSEGGGLSLFQARKRSANVTFQVRYKTELGEQLRVVGSSPELGAWDIAKAPQLKYKTDGDVDGIWVCDVKLPCGQIYEYKYVVCNDQGVPLQWQQGNNALLAVGIRDAIAQNSGGGQISLEVLDRWSGPEGSSVVIKKGGQVVQETTREHRLTAWIKDVEDQLEQGAVQVKELQLELASAKQELMSTRQEVVQAREESMKMKEMAMQSNDKYLLALKEKEKALRQKELVLRQLQLDRFEQQK